MKYIKILLLITIIFYSKTIYAKTFYSDYYEVQEENIGDISKTIETKKYNTYSINKVDMGYLDDNNEYIKDEEDYIIKNQSQEFTIYNSTKKTKGIFINRLRSNYKIYEIEVYYENEKIDYDIAETGIYGNYKNINDNNYNTYYSLDNLYIAINLLFDKEYNLNDLEIRMYIDSDIDINLNFGIETITNITFDKNYKGPYIVKFSNNNSSTSVIDNKMYRYYKEEKIINNIYVEAGDNIIENDYIMEKKYYNRDKLVLKDNIEINNLDYDLNDYILFKTGDVLTSCNIDINKNGLYKCNFKLNNIDIYEYIKINIQNNLLEEYKSDLDLMNNINESTNNEEIKNTTYLEEDNIDIINIELFNDNYQNYKKETYIDSNQDRIVNTVNKSSDNNYLKVEKIKKNMNKKLIKIIIALILIIINLYIIIKKTRKKVESI